MDAATLKIEFDKQLKDAEAKIVEAEKNLKQLNEYKTKLFGWFRNISVTTPKARGDSGWSPRAIATSYRKYN